jgi:hypothetical protein
MRLPLVVLSLCLPLPLLVGCPGGGTGEEGAADSTTHDDPTAADSTDSTSSTTAAATDTTAPPATETDATSLGETETDTAPPDTDTDTNGQVPGCECILDQDPMGGMAGPADPVCGEALCPVVSGACAPSYCELGDPYTLDDPAALECALTALRDRTPGIVTWDHTEGRGILTDHGYILIKEDGTAVRRNWTREDLSFRVSDAVLGELPPLESFDACLAEPDDLARFNCMRAELETPNDVCDGGWICGECV